MHCCICLQLLFSLSLYINNASGHYAWEAIYDFSLFNLQLIFYLWKLCKLIWIWTWQTRFWISSNESFWQVFIALTSWLKAQLYQQHCWSRCNRATYTRCIIAQVSRLEILHWTLGTSVCQQRAALLNNCHKIEKTADEVPCSTAAAKHAAYSYYVRCPWKQWGHLWSTISHYSTFLFYGTFQSK